MISPRMDGKGRALACEIMVVTELVKQCIREPGRTAEIKGVIEKGRTTYGLQTFDQHLIDLVNRKQITMDIARGAASSPADFERALNFE